MALRSEDDFLSLIDRHFPRSGPGILLGRGDDCAVLQVPERICLTTDLFLEDVHFRLDYFSPADVGFKALAVNLSDIAAMGARPLGFALDLMVRPGLDQDFFEALFGSMAGLARDSGCPLVGGDLSRADRLGLSITAWGTADRFLARGMGRPGDHLFLVGPVGLARVGLELLEQRDPTARDFPAAVAAHLRPEVRLNSAARLAARPEVLGLMDVSDGLARDLPRFLGPDLGLDLSLTGADLHPEVLAHAARIGVAPLELALLGGEDYALLGAVSAPGLDRLLRDIPEALHLGRIVDRSGIRVRGQSLDLTGFDHFTGEEP